MRKKTKGNVVALLLVLVLAVSSLAACGKKESNSIPEEKDGKQETENRTENQPEGDGEETEPEEQEKNDSGLPLTEEKKELSVWLR